MFPQMMIVVDLAILALFFAAVGLIERPSAATSASA